MSNTLNTCTISDAFLKHLLVEKGLIPYNFDGEIVIYKEPVIEWTDVPNDWHNEYTPIDSETAEIIEVVYASGETDINYDTNWSNYWNQQNKHKYTITKYRILPVTDNWIDIPNTAKSLLELNVPPNNTVEVLYSNNDTEYSRINKANIIRFNKAENYTNLKYRTILEAK